MVQVKTRESCPFAQFHTILWSQTGGSKGVVPWPLNLGTKRKWLFSFTCEPLYCIGSSSPWYSTKRRQGWHADSLDIITTACLKSDTLHYKNVAFMSVPQVQEYRQKKKKKKFRKEHSSWKSAYDGTTQYNDNHFQQFLCLCVNMVFCFSGYFMMQNSISCVVSNEKLKNKSKFRVLKNVESDNHTASVSAQVYSEKWYEFQLQQRQEES
jgi:hypothetical protein